jgi:hypothetical protein
MASEHIEYLAYAVVGRKSCVEAGSNTYTVALRVVGGDEKEPSA